MNETKKKQLMFVLLHWRKSKIKRTNLTWLPLEIMHRGHTRHDYPWPWHDYPWPWHDYYIICSYDVRRWFRKLTVRFRPIRKEIVSSMCNKINNQRCSLFWYVLCHPVLSEMRGNQWNEDKQKLELKFSSFLTFLEDFFRFCFLIPFPDCLILRKRDSDWGRGFKTTYLF